MFKITLSRTEIAANLHLNSCKIRRIANDVLYLFEIVVMKRYRRAPESFRTPAVGMPVEKVSCKGIVFAKVYRYIPVVPTVIATDCHLILTGIGTCNTYAHRVGFATTTGVSYTTGPWIHLDEPFCEINFQDS